MGYSRHDWHDWDEIWVRHCAVRCLHRAHRRRSDCASCGVLVGDVVGKKVTTESEALAEGTGVLTKVQQAWVDLDVPQCGYCQSGMIMAVSALLHEKPNPTDADIDNAITNICRCGTFQQVRAAIHAAASA